MMINIKKKRSVDIISNISLPVINSVSLCRRFIYRPGDRQIKAVVSGYLIPGEFSGKPLSQHNDDPQQRCFYWLAAFLAAYTLIAGTMSTAHDGEMLGKKWSSMWLPVRTALGTAMILPAAGGFCAAQVMVLWMINQGVGLADTIWNTYASNPSDGAVITTSASYQELDRIAKNCVYQ